MPPLASLTDVGKRYVKYDDVPTIVTGVRQMFRRGRRSRLWAVRHVDLEVGKGEAIGILGRNGSGKSTTLSMLAGVTAPTEGIVKVNGRIAPLLRVGVGFDQELTGRENVYINGMILGMTIKEIERSFDDVVAFAEIEEFIDTPVKFYSSGMLVRLGFASAVSAEPELLIIDEVLSVGDAAFQTRSFDRMLEMRENGATLVVVSHNLQAIRQLADSCIVLHAGEVQFRGSTNDAISVYYQLLREPLAWATSTARESTADAVSVLSFEMVGENGVTGTKVDTGESVTFLMRTRFDKTVEQAVVGMTISTDTGVIAYAENWSGVDAHSFQAGEERTFKISLPMRLVSGSYVAGGGLQWGTVFIEQAIGPRLPFYVSGRHRVQGVADLHATFAVETAGDHVPQEPSSLDSDAGPSSAAAEPRERR